MPKARMRRHASGSYLADLLEPDEALLDAQLRPTVPESLRLLAIQNIQAGQFS